MSETTKCECGDEWCGYGDPMGYEDKDTLNHFMRLYKIELDRERARSSALEKEVVAMGEENARAREELTRQIACVNEKVAAYQRLTAERNELWAANTRLRKQVKAKAAYYEHDARELKREAERLAKTDTEGAMFRAGCADYALGFASELRRMLLAESAASPQPGAEEKAR